MQCTNFAARPLFGLLLARVNLVVLSSVAVLALLMHLFPVIPALCVLDVIGAAAYLSIPSRRAETVRRLRHKHRGEIASKMRCTDREHWLELEKTVEATRPSLPRPRSRELEQLLDLFVDVGVNAARWESQIEHFGRPPAAPSVDGLAPLVRARDQRRTRATRALESLTGHLSTLSTLILLGCEDAVAARASASVGDIGAHVEEARRAAQLAIEATEEVDAAWPQLLPQKA